MVRNLGARIGQKALAYQIVKDIHGADKADEAINMSNALFSGDIKSLTQSQLEELLGDLTFEVNEDIKLEDALILTKAASSKREARQFCASNAVSVNGDKVIDPNYVLTKDNALFNKYNVIRRGKKLYFLIKHN